MLDVINLSVKYINRPRPTISNLSLCLRHGEVTAILGPTGSGKSTLLHALLGILDPSVSEINGEILENGIHTYLPRCRNEPSGVAFQKPIFFSWLTLKANVVSIINSSDKNEISRKEKYDLLDELLHEFGLWDQRNYFPAQASGGMLSRLNIARAICAMDSYLFIDESLSGIDEVMREKIANIVAVQTRSRNLITALITHNLSDAILYADSSIVLYGSPISCTDTVNRLTGNELDSTSIEQLRSICRKRWYQTS